MCHWHVSPFAVTPTLASGQQHPEDSAARKPQDGTRPGVIFGDPGSSTLCPKVPSSHRGRSQTRDPGASVLPGFHEGPGGLGHGSGAERVPPPAAPSWPLFPAAGGSTVWWLKPGQKEKWFCFIT